MSKEALFDKSPEFSSRELMEFLARTLNHQIRTPLSVISNDLQYMDLSLGEAPEERAVKGELAQPLRQVASIAETLNALTSIIHDESEKITCPLGEEIKKTLCPLYGSQKFEVLDFSASALVSVSRLFPDRLGKALMNLFREVFREEPTPHRVVFVREEKRISMQFSAHFSYWNMEAQQTYQASSFSRLFYKFLGIDLLVAPLLDAIIWEAGGSIQLEVTTLGEISVGISFGVIK